MGADVTLDGVREYSERYPVTLRQRKDRLCLRAENEGQNNEVLIDLDDLIEWLHTNGYVAKSLNK